MPPGQKVLWGIEKVRLYVHKDSLLVKMPALYSMGTTPQGEPSFIRFSAFYMHLPLRIHRLGIFSSYLVRLLERSRDRFVLPESGR